jgi:hypothetical protein
VQIDAVERDVAPKAFAEAAVFYALHVIAGIQQLSRISSEAAGYGDVVNYNTSSQRKTFLKRSDSFHAPGNQAHALTTRRRG